MVSIYSSTIRKSQEDKKPIIKSIKYYNDSNLKILLFLVLGMGVGCIIAAICVHIVMIVKFKGGNVPSCAPQLQPPDPESMIWSDKNIAYWSTIDPIPPSDPNDKVASQSYEEAMFLKQEAIMRGMKCVPKKGVFRVEDLLEEDEEKKNELLDVLVPYQKVVLERCLPQSSYCGEVYGAKCKPTKEVKQGSKRIAVVIKNGTHDGEEAIVTFYVEEHVHCSCQCSCNYKDYDDEEEEKKKKK